MVDSEMELPGANRVRHLERAGFGIAASAANGERRDRLAVVGRLPFPHQIEKGREARTAPATGIEHAAHAEAERFGSTAQAVIFASMNGTSPQKTGYADPRVARRRSRLNLD